MPVRQTCSTSRIEYVEANLISAGYLHSLALRSDGTLLAWGDSSQGQLAIPQNLNAIVLNAVAEDTAGNLTTSSITVYRTPDSGGNLVNAVQLAATPIGGFVPLTATLTPSLNLPSLPA